jgi:hypothetical protein
MIELGQMAMVISLTGSILSRTKISLASCPPQYLFLGISRMRFQEGVARWNFGVLLKSPKHWITSTLSYIKDSLDYDFSWL